MTTTPPTSEDLQETWFLDYHHPSVAAFVATATEGVTDGAERLRRLFEAVRDGVRYDPYSLSQDPRDYRASTVAGAAGAYCVPKAVLFVASCRAVGVPARLGFADVKNHLQSDRLLEVMGTDLFRYHGYAAVWSGSRWVKASPAFNRELCARFGVPALEFDGTEDALLHAFTGDGRRHMEYVTDHGTFADLPLDEILDAYRRAYPAMELTGPEAVGDEVFSE